MIARHPPTSADVPPLERGDRNLNPPGLGLLALLDEDRRTQERGLLTQGFWVLALHRFGNWRMDRPRPLRAPLSLIYKLLYPLTECLCGIKLSYTVRVGRRVRLEHFGGMIIGARSIGDDCVIRQNTTLGVARRTQRQAKPVIEERVDIGAGVAILGQVRVGHDSVIGANAVVVKDVPAYAIVGGVPAKVIRMREDDGQARAAPQPTDEQAGGGEPIARPD